MKSLPGGSTDWHLPDTWCLVLFALATGLVYGASFGHGWTYDDYYVVVANPAARSLDALLQKGIDWRVLRDLSLLVDFKIWGDDPAGYHLQQLLLHWVNACLIYLFCRQHGGLRLPAAAGTLLFIVHPLQVESVANISHRKEALALLFVLLLLHGYRTACRVAGGRRWVALAASAVALLCAVLANETAATAPLLLLAYEWLFLAPEERLLLRHPRLLILFGACALLAGGWFLHTWFPLEEQIRKVFTKNAFYASPAYLPLLLGCLQVVALYVGKLLMPLWLAPEYVVSFSSGLWQPLAWCGLGITFVVGWLGWWLRLRCPLGTFGLVTAALLYLPIANLYPVAYMMADRYLYLPLAGLAMLVASCGGALERRMALRGAAALLLVALTVLAFRQNAVWGSEHTLWRHAVQVNPRSSWVQGAVAKSYLREGRLDLARTHGERAIAIDRNNAGAYLTLARAEERSGNLPTAVEYYQTFLALGAAEFPREATDVAAYLPYLQRRLQAGR